MANSDIKRHNPGPLFNQIVIHDAIVYLSGQVSEADDTVAGQTRGILQKIDALLDQAGTDKSRILTAAVWVSDVSGVKAMNEEWLKWVDKENMPARACVESKLVRESLLVEIQVTAALPSPAKIIETDQAASAVGPYNQGIVVKDGTVYVSGCIGLTTEGQMAGSSVEAQTEQALSNLKAIVEAAGAKVEHVVKTTILLHEINDFAAVNAIYSKFFEGVDVPARSCFAAKQLPKAALVEIEAIAMLP